MVIFENINILEILYELNILYFLFDIKIGNIYYEFVILIIIERQSYFQKKLIYYVRGIVNFYKAVIVYNNIFILRDKSRLNIN